MSQTIHKIGDKVLTDLGKEGIIKEIYDDEAVIVFDDEESDFFRLDDLKEIEQEDSGYPEGSSILEALAFDVGISAEDLLDFLHFGKARIEQLTDELKACKNKGGEE